jgi:hypothetical protein
VRVPHPRALPWSGAADIRAEKQTVAFNIAARVAFKHRVRRRMGVWQAMEMLNTLVDESDPDVSVLHPSPYTVSVNHPGASDITTPHPFLFLHPFEPASRYIPRPRISGQPDQWPVGSPDAFRSFLPLPLPASRPSADFRFARPSSRRSSICCKPPRRSGATASPSGCRSPGLCTTSASCSSSSAAMASGTSSACVSASLAPTR